MARRGRPPPSMRAWHAHRYVVALLALFVRRKASALKGFKAHIRIQPKATAGAASVQPHAPRPDERVSRARVKLA